LPTNRIDTPIAESDSFQRRAQRVAPAQLLADAHVGHEQRDEQVDVARVDREGQ
jgi:hypothetical protein